MKTTIPLRIKSPNQKQHWAKQARENKNIKTIIGFHLKMKGKAPSVPAIVTITRIAIKPLDEHDNLPMSLKYVSDAIAEWLIPGLAPGMADGSKLIQWNFANRKGKICAVEIEIEEVKRIQG